MFEDYFKTSEEAGSLYRVEDLLGVVKVILSRISEDSSTNGMLP